MPTQIYSGAGQPRSPTPSKVAKSEAGKQSTNTYSLTNTRLTRSLTLVSNSYGMVPMR